MRSKRTTFTVTRGLNFAPIRRKLAAELTKELLESGAWATTSFKAYNFESAGREPGGGHVHALMKVRAEFRSILLEMGFSEMPTNRFVESSFWNFDALFQPQSHPSRDMHDTFFVSGPAETLAIPPAYLEAVKRIHEVGGHGSLGYRYEWKVAEARKNLLRTHTTAVSARMLYALANVSGIGTGHTAAPLASALSTSAAYGLQARFMHPYSVVAPMPPAATRRFPPR